MLSRRKCINLDITSTCTLECPDCQREVYKQKGLKVPGHNMSIEEFKIVYNYFEEITFCGQISDPIFNPNFIDMLKMCHNRKVNIHTAASHKPWDWYMKAFDACPNARWEFGLDGLPEESSTYRKNQDGDKIFDLMVEGKKRGIKIVWQYIIFDYNKNNIDEAKQMAEKHGIKFNLIEQYYKQGNSPQKIAWIAPK